MNRWNTRQSSARLVMRPATRRRRRTAGMDDDNEEAFRQLRERGRTRRTRRS